MGDITEIGWTDKTHNEWWGCARWSRGCRFCYAADLARRWGFNDLWGANGPRRVMSKSTLRKPARWNREAEAAGVPIKVFSASMADVFEDHPALPPLRERLFRRIEETPWLVWQLLTKRIENVAGMAPWGNDWPPNVWLGTSVENQRFANQRVPVLARLRGPKVLFLSVEPLVGPVDPERIEVTAPGHAPVIWDSLRARPVRLGDEDRLPERRVDWVIVGGESGPKAAPMHPRWPEKLRDQAVAAGVPFFFKQWGTWSPYARKTPEGTYLASDLRRPYAVAEDGTAVYKPGELAYPDGPRYAEAFRRGHGGRVNLTHMYRVGKKAAGDLLDEPDGTQRRWQQFPPIYAPETVAA